MRDELAEHGHRISPGTLYPVLHRMQDAGLLISRQQVVHGRVRRLYRATDAGREELTACRRVLAELDREILPDQDVRS
jgi:DNA-binding PadR family transcriptional regulator